MTRAAIALLELEQLPLRLTAAQAATRLGLTVEEVRIIASAEVLQQLVDDAPAALRRKLLPPSQRLLALGSPAQQAVKYFATCDVENRAQDCDWLDRAHRSIHRHWKVKAAIRNERKRKTPNTHE